MTRRVEFVPPGSSKLLAGRMVGPLFVSLFWAGHCFDIGLELWRAGAAVNIGPLSLGIGVVRDVVPREVRL